MTGLLVALAVGALILAVALSVGIMVLIKMGVIVRYATREEPADQADYELEQSHEVSRE
jgi:hypothetical protein